ncbi:glycosyltransferase [Hydrogenimonas urashimensis]|uniref:glycosyltransferase n=1 Tax=Hydrogenimonas urashimensis TaxID=2740515 RepID=UPI001916A0C3|nr:glycosyltransferase [Hydrogenimonas urashimensis]
MSKLLILQTAAPDYRKKFFDLLRHKLGKDFILYAGEDYFEPTIQTSPNIKFRKRVKNFYFFGRRFLWQSGMWKDALSSNILVMEMNPRILSNWIILCIRKTIGKKNILWGHAWPRSGKNSRSDIVRNTMRMLADIIVTYTKTQAKELKERMPNKDIRYAPNALYYSHEMVPSNNRNPINIIYVGRLTKNKKPSLLIEAFVKALPYIPMEAKLIMIGDGDERKNIEKLVKKLNIENRVEMPGHIGDYYTLAKLYATALFSVSPGYVGLSITQSFGFGVPMLISRDENHSPEIEAAIENENSIFFNTNDIEDFAEKILFFYEKKISWLNKRKAICDNCRSFYSIEAMANTFLNITKSE